MIPFIKGENHTNFKNILFKDINLHAKAIENSRREAIAIEKLIMIKENLG